MRTAGTSKHVSDSKGSRVTPVNGVKKVVTSSPSRSTAPAQVGHKGSGLKGPNPNSICC